MYCHHEVIRRFQKIVDALTMEKIHKLISYTCSSISYNLSVSEPQQQGEKSVHTYCSQCY